ncbi:MAG: hypothetical protein EON95_06670 [Caulobacteraceae bacterium]|nr:MAG: hypothetical protein EON95_06670 [Caulobacteraceae bacterium]
MKTSTPTAPSIVVPEAPDYRLAPLIADVIRQENLERLRRHPAFEATARRTMAAWVPPAGDLKALGRTLRDIATFMAALWAMQLTAETGAMTRTGLARIMADWGVASQSRVGALLVYLKLVGLIERGPPLGDDRTKAYRPTAQLRRLFHDRFRRELTNCLPIMPEVGAVLARWDEPLVFDGFMAANGRFMLATQQSLTGAPDNLSLFSHRKSGISILSQMLLAADTGGAFPPAGPVRLNISDLARTCSASRQQVLAILRVGTEAGFMREDDEGLVHFSPELRHHVSAMLRMYWVSMAWSGQEALRWVDRKAG